MALSAALARDAPAQAHATGFRTEIVRDWAQAEAAFGALARQGAALAFQRRDWLANWYGAHAATHSPVLATLFQADGAPAMALPLALHRHRGMRVITFADAGLTDYNAPILGPAAPRTAAEGAAALASLRRALPPADLLHFAKMPLDVGGRTNALGLLPQARPSTLNGNILHVPGAWEEWHRGLERTFRKELERSLRVFSKHPGASFVRVGTAAQAEEVFAQLERQQRERVQELGLPYILDAPASSAFYDGMLRDGIASGSAVLTALMAGETVVAALLGIVEGQHYAMVRLSTAGAEWKTCSPGRLLIERTMKAMHAQGCRSFDFTIGDYAYKRRLGAEPLPLSELNMALSWRGLPHIARLRARDAVKASPLLAGWARRLRGR